MVIAGLSSWDCFNERDFQNLCDILNIYSEHIAISLVIKERLFFFFFREKQSNSKTFPFNCGKFETEITDFLFLLELFEDSLNCFHEVTWILIW